MPCVSEFYGIRICMYYNDHNPPDFHAEYAEDEATFSIGGLAVLTGDIGRRARALVLEWASLHRSELMDNWEMAREGLPLESIDSLD